jgi:hypothetical protein
MQIGDSIALVTGDQVTEPGVTPTDTTGARPRPEQTTWMSHSCRYYDIDVTFMSFATVCSQPRRVRDGIMRTTGNRVPP